VQRDRDLGVGAPVAQVLEHVGLPAGQQLGAVVRAPIAGRRLGEELQAA
jgi:hypothetical protein